MTSCLQMTSILVLAFFIISCTRQEDGMVRGRRSINSLMDSVECLMDDYPAKADSMMQRIDIQSVKNEEQRARYALLYTATQYKNYQPFTSDSLIMQAVNYYSNSINYDYRFLSFYYLGCVYMEMKQYTEASVAMLQAELLTDRIDNEFWKGLLYAFMNTTHPTAFLHAQKCAGTMYPRNGRPTAVSTTVTKQTPSL